MFQQVKDENDKYLPCLYNSCNSCGITMKYHSLIVLVAVCLCFLFLNLNCKKDNPLTPPDDTPGRRDYTWFIDTIYAGGNIINSIDGASSNDVWATTIPGDYSQTLYHFNGTKWITDGINRSLDPYSVHVFSSNNVWSVGSSGEIWQYDGKTWKLNAKAPSPGTIYYGLSDINGTTIDDLYAVGKFSKTGSDFYSLIYHYDGSMWTRMNLEENPYLLYYIRYLNKNRYFILGIRYQSDTRSNDTSKIFLFDGSSLQEFYTGVANSNGYGDFCPVPNGMIVAEGKRILITDGNQRMDITTIQSDMFINGIKARNEKDIIIAMTDGIAQYNGTDVQYLYHFSGTNTRILGMKLFNNGVFVIARDWNINTNYIFRGYLN